MIYASLPHPPGSPALPLPFYLAMEEHLARNYPGGDYFFMWQVEPTVIFGRCQNPFKEVNLDFCRSEGIRTFRRRSGGGTVYADMDNIMMSHVTTCSQVTSSFSEYCSLIAATLRKLGLKATATGRNDILIDKQKVSGNAFYNLHNRGIVHGTMLFDADPARMASAITPSSVKLRAKGVRSASSRITTIRRHLPEITIEEFKAFMREQLCDSTQVMTPEDIAEIKRIAEIYFSERWIFGKYADGNQSLHPIRIEDVGEFFPSLNLLPPDEPGAPPTIDSVALTGDFFLLSDLDEGLLDHLKGVKLTKQDISEALAHLRPGDVISGLTTPMLAKMLVTAADLSPSLN